MFKSGTEEGLRQTIAAQQATIALLEKQYDKLFDAYHGLRTSGANAQPAGLAPVKRSLLPADLAIEDVCEAKGNPIGLRKILQRFVNLERQKPNYDDAAERAVADRVRNWRDPDSDEDVA